MVTLDEKELSMITGSALFKGLDDEFILSALNMESVKLRSYKSNDAILAAGSDARRLAILIQGSAQVYKFAAAERVPMSMLKAGDMIGMAGMFVDDAHMVTEIISKGPSKFVSWSEVDLRFLMQSSFTVAENYMRHLTEKIHFLTGRIENIASPTAADKLLNYLCTNQAYGIVCVTCGFTKLAATLSMSRASLYRVMDDLAREGYIKRDKNEIILLNKQGGTHLL